MYNEIGFYFGHRQLCVPRANEIYFAVNSIPPLMISIVEGIIEFIQCVIFHALLMSRQIFGIDRLYVIMLCYW